jgi:hypothetical protein
MSSSTFTIPLVPEGDSNAEYRLRNEYAGQIERPNILDYGTNLNVQGDLMAVVHGTMTPGGDPATLIIADFQFTSLALPRRFRQALITFLFKDTNSKDENPPEVLKIAPQGIFSMNKTEKTQTIQRGANVSLGAGFGPANGSIGFNWSLSETKTKHDQATLSGIKTVINRGRPPKNAARWSLHENDDGVQGIPNFVRLAILLRRKTSEKFLAVVVVQASVDFMYTFEKRSGKVDPITFDPSSTHEPENSIEGIDPTNLGLVDLKNLAVIQSDAQSG